ncbi:MAG TPA: chemotaxis protein CheW [Gemmatimonadales bacterium]|jgi:chemotaxis signal transduction protein
MTDPGQRVGGLVVQMAGARWYIPVESVIEVLRDARMVRVPGGSAAVRGMANHRGRILVVADAVRALDLGGGGATGSEVVVVEWEGRRFGLVTDAVVELVGEARTGLAEIDLGQIATAIFA